MSGSCNYLCGPKYCSKQYSRKTLEKVDAVVDSLKQYVEKLVSMCSDNVCHERAILKSTDVTSWYTPGVAFDLMSVASGYVGPSVYVEVETSLRVDKSHVSKAFTYVVQLNGVSYSMPDSEFYLSDKDGSDKYLSVLNEVKSVYAQLPLFDFSMFDKHLESNVKEFRDTMAKRGVETLL